MLRILLCFLLITTGATAQVPVNKVDTSFRPLIDWFQKNRPSLDPKGLPPLKLPLVYAPDRADIREFSVVFSDSVLNLQTEKLIVKVPHRTSPYPIDYSVVWQNRLVSLFDSVGFICLTIDGLERDSALEKRLSAKAFLYHWLLDGQLIGLSGTTPYWFDESYGWRRYTKPVPMTKQPTLYEDERYIAYSTCQGEFGGVLYFYDKRTRLTHFAILTCARSIIRQPEGYYALASLGHMMGSADLNFIENPSALPVFKRVNRYGIPQADSTRLAGSVKPSVLFDKYDIQLFSAFLHQGKFTYVANWGGRTFLSGIMGDTVVIKHPLFNTELYTHNPVTTTINAALTVVSLDFYGAGGAREIACLLIEPNRVRKISWNVENDVR